jgi:hypothetical protein
MGCGVTAFIATYWPILALAYVGVLMFIVRAFMAWSGADHRTDSDLEREVANLRRIADDQRQSHLFIGEAS